MVNENLFIFFSFCKLGGLVVGEGKPRVWRNLDAWIELACCAR